MQMKPPHRINHQTPPAHSHTDKSAEQEATHSLTRRPRLIGHHLRAARGLCDLTHPQPSSGPWLERYGPLQKGRVRRDSDGRLNAGRRFTKQKFCISVPAGSPLLPQSNYWWPLKQPPLIFSIASQPPPPSPQPAAVLHLSGNPAIIGFHRGSLSLHGGRPLETDLGRGGVQEGTRQESIHMKPSQRADRQQHTQTRGLDVGHRRDRRAGCWLFNC